MRLNEPGKPSLEWREKSQPCFFNVNGTELPCERTVPPGCSECSNVVGLFNDPLAPYTNSCSILPWVAHDYTDLWWEFRSMLFMHHAPPQLYTVLAILSLLALLLGAAAYSTQKVPAEADTDPCCRSPTLPVDPPPP